MKDRKETTLHLRLTKAERATIERLAADANQRMSATVRGLIQEALIKRANQEGVTR
jgi:hypothetical protein